MKITLLVALLLLTGLTAFAQETNGNERTESNSEKETITTTQHKVLMGETVMLICKKYVVSPEDIYELNPEAVDGISPGMVLIIPVEEKAAIKPAKTKPKDTSVTSRHAKKENE